MTRQLSWAKRERIRLKVLLGLRCARCNLQLTPDADLSKLAFDCIIPQGHKHHSLGLVNRMCFYRRMLAAGNLQLLCGPCNTKKSAKEQLLYGPCNTKKSAKEQLNAMYDELAFI